jgi:hypothetical protein
MQKEDGLIIRMHRIGAADVQYTVRTGKRKIFGKVIADESKANKVERMQEERKEGDDYVYLQPLSAEHLHKAEEQQSNQRGPSIQN